MTVETATYISQLDATYPAAGDQKNEGDNHIRLLKSTIKATFPNVAGAVTPTHTEINYVDGVTSAIQTQFDAITTKSTDEAVSVFDYLSTAQKADVRTGALTLDTAAAFASAIATGKPVLVPGGPTWAYLIGSTLSVPSNTQIYSNRAKLKLAASVNNHVIRIADGADNVEIRGLEIDGNKTNNTGGIGIAMGGTGGSNVRVKDCYVHDCSSHGIYFAGSSSCTGILAADNYCYNNYSAGVTCNDTVIKFAFERNLCWNNGTHGVGIIGIAKHGAIVGNVCWGNGIGTPNADDITGYNASNENITVTGNTCYDSSNNGIHMGGTLITVSGNVVHNALYYGIVVSPSTGTGDDCVITGNTIYSSGLAGIWLKDCNSGVISSNVVRSSAGSGMLIDNCQNIAINANNIRASASHGITAPTASLYLSITGNTIHANGADGIDLDSITRSTITGNLIQGNTGYGIGTGGTEANNLINGNIVRGNTAGQIQQPATTTKVTDNDTNTSRTVASAATVTLPPGGEYFYITGTTGITSITASFAERRVTLKFDDVLTITEGSNLIMAGNFTTSFTDTITFMCDGTNWNETCRSNN